MRDGEVLRISVTDRCDLRCVYCMPESGVPLVPAADILTYEEIVAVARAALAVGVRRFRLTGGEPLARRGIARLVEALARLGPDDLAMTTNGLRLADEATALEAAGLMRVTVSLDTLRPGRFERIARRPGLDRVLAGIEAARRVGLQPVKVNTVVIRGQNDDEIGDFVRFAIRERIEVRFIELMPTTGLGPDCKELGSWGPGLFLSGEEVRARIEAAFGPLRRLPGRDGVAEVHLLSDGTRIGFITPVSRPFCEGCGRLRLGPEGRLRICLFDREGLDLRGRLRGRGGGTGELEALLRSALALKESWARGDISALASDMSRVGG